MSDSIQRMPEVIKKTGLSRATIYRFMSHGSFPKPISLGLNSVGWLSSEIDSWIRSRIASSRF